MKCQSLFSGKNKKTISKCHLLNFLPSMLSIKIGMCQVSDFVSCAQGIWPIHLTGIPGYFTGFVCFSLNCYL